jgi:hypothetical protein
MRDPEARLVTPTERLERLDAAIALYGSAKSWVERAFASFLVIMAGDVALGMGASPAVAKWTVRGAAIVFAVCMWRSVVFYLRAEKIAKDTP